MTLRLLLLAACLLLTCRSALSLMAGCDTYRPSGVLLGVLAHVAATWSAVGAAFCVYGVWWSFMSKRIR